MSDVRTSVLLSPEAMGSFDAEGNYTPRTIVDDDLGDADLEQAMGDSIIEFDDGDVIMGTVVKIDRDEVLLDIGFKSEGVIPARELSIRNDGHPEEIVSLGEETDAINWYEQRLAVERDARRITTDERDDLAGERGVRRAELRVQDRDVVCRQRSAGWRHL